MERKYAELLLVLGGIAIAMFATVRLLSGGWYDMFWVLACLVPFLLALFLRIQNWWPFWAIIIPLIPLPGVSQVLLDRITPQMMFNMAMMAFFVANICIFHKGVLMDTKYTRPMLIVALAITIRLLLDRPGSGRMGGTGGLAMALEYFMAGWMYFVVWWSVQESTVSEKKFFQGLIGVTTLIFIWKISTTSTYLVQQTFYHRRAWMFYPLILSWVAYRFGVLKHKWSLFYFLSCFVMGCGVVNIHRKSLFMALSVCLVIAWIYRITKKQIITLSVVGMLGLGFLISTGNVPRIMKRSLSVILPSLTQTKDMGAMGWDDPFRERNFKLAMADISRNPFFGRGFSFSTKEVVSMLNRQRIGGIGASSDIADAVGTHHYGFLSLMTCIGAIFPWFYAVCLFGILWKFASYARNKAEGYSKVLAAGLTGYFINNLFQWLFNGAGRQMLILSVALGVMVGLLQRWGAFDEEKDDESTEEPDSPVRLVRESSQTV